MTAKLLLAVGFMNLRIFDLKVLNVSELQMLESNLFHSIMVDQKYEFLKLVLHIDIGNIKCISSSIQTI